MHVEHDDTHKCDLSAGFWSEEDELLKAFSSNPQTVLRIFEWHQNIKTKNQYGIHSSIHSYKTLTDMMQKFQSNTKIRSSQSHNVSTFNNLATTPSSQNNDKNTEAPADWYNRTLMTLYWRRWMMIDPPLIAN